MTLDRYRGIVPGWDRFLEAAGTPEPTAIRVRTGRISPEALVRRLEASGFRLEPLPAVPAFRRIVEEPYPVSQTLEHWLGLFYIQQAVMGLPAAALGARPGERVLDLCAAPGGKTTHLADLMGDRGALVAVDVSDKRLRGLLGNVYRVGHPGVVAVAADGRNLPGGAAFDRVLVDAPCSAEGNLRTRGGEPQPRDASFVEHVTSVQEHLLRRAVGLTRPGGRVLYATCTFAPEENEGVVDRVLREVPAALEPIPLDAPHAPGLVRLGRRAFDPSLERAWRVWPHQLDSGGLFMALLRKEGRDAGAGSTGGFPGPDGGPAVRGPEASGAPVEAPGSAPGWSPVPPVFPEDETTGAEARERIEAALGHLTRVWGVGAEALESLGWFCRGDSIWLHTCAGWPFPAWEGRGGWRLLSVGIRALTADRRFGTRLTNDGIRRLADGLEARTVRLTPHACLRLLEEGGRPADGAPAGNVALAVGDDVVGRGVVRGGRLRHEIPKGRARRLRQVLGFREAGGG